MFATYGDDAWEKGVKRVFRAEDIERLEIQFNKRYSSPAGPVRPGEDLYEMLDINYFVNIIEGNWKKTFASSLNNDRTLLSYIREIVLYRNPIAHPESGDLKDDDTFRGLDTAERILRLIEPEVTIHVERIKEEFRNAWVQDGAEIKTLKPQDVGVDVTKGFNHLEQKILEKNEKKSSSYKGFSKLKKEFANGVSPKSVNTCDN